MCIYVEYTAEADGDGSHLGRCWKSTSCLEREDGGRVASLLLAIAFGTVVGAQLQQVVSEPRLRVQILRLTSALGQVQVGRNCVCRTCGS